MPANFHFRITGGTHDSSYVRIEIDGTVDSLSALRYITQCSGDLFLDAGADLPRKPTPEEPTDGEPE